MLWAGALTIALTVVTDRCSFRKHGPPSEQMLRPNQCNAELKLMRIGVPTSRRPCDDKR